MTAKINAPYTTGVYRSNSDSPLPPPKWAEDANRSGNFDTHLAFGHYANLEPATETSNQLQGEEQYIYISDNINKKKRKKHIAMPSAGAFKTQARFHRLFLHVK